MPDLRQFRVGCSVCPDLWQPDTMHRVDGYIFVGSVSVAMIFAKVCAPYLPYTAWNTFLLRTPTAKRPVCAPTLRYMASGCSCARALWRELRPRTPYRFCRSIGRFRQTCVGQHPRNSPQQDIRRRQHPISAPRLRPPLRQRPTTPIAQRRFVAPPKCAHRTCHIRRGIRFCCAHPPLKG